MRMRGLFEQGRPLHDIWEKGMKQNIQKALHALLALMLILTSVSIPVQANEDPAAAAVRENEPLTVI